VSLSTGRPLVIAHRGASAVEYENSLAAFRAARRLGADGVELDVHTTTDGELFVHHDSTVDGLRIPRATAAQVAQRRLPNGEAVPTLAQALAELPAPLRIFVEVKTLPPGSDGRLLEVLEQGAPGGGRYAVHSFDHRIIGRLGAVRPTLQRGVLLASYPIRPLDALADTGATVLWEDYSLIDAALVEEVHGGGDRIFAWTVDDSSDMQRLMDLGVDGLCTNHPDVARRVVGPATPARPA